MSLSEGGRSSFEKRSKLSTSSTPSMVETPLTSTRHLKRQSSKISVGQRMHKVSISSHDVVGARKMCIKPNSRNHGEQKLLSLRSILSSQKRKKTTMWNPNLLRQVNKGKNRKGWCREQTLIQAEDEAWRMVAQSWNWIKEQPQSMKSVIKKAMKTNRQEGKEVSKGTLRGIAKERRKR